MRDRPVGAVVLGLFLVMAIARAATGQTTISLNYDPLLHELTENSSLGGHGDVAKAFGPVALIGEIGANHFNQATVITLAPGVRYAFAVGTNAKIQPAVQAVAGLWHCSACETNASFLQPGVVVDYVRSGAVTFRAQFDVRRIFFDFGGETAERVGVGVVWKLK
jgi:hypothetical protein